MKTLYETLEFDKVLDFLSENAVSQSGVLLCKNAEVFNDIEKIQYEMLLTTQAKKLLDYNFKLPLQNFTDLSKKILDTKKFIKLEAEEIIETVNILRNSRLVFNFLQKFNEEFPELFCEVENLYIDKNFEDKVDRIFDSTGNVKEDATPYLKSLHQSLTDTKSNIKNVISKLMSNSDILDNLRDTVYTQRDGRTVFQVKAECKTKIQGIVHDVSASGQTFFIEPKELTELHNKERETEILIKAEIEKILAELSQYISQKADEIINSIKILGRIDFIFAKAKYSVKLDANPAELITKREIKINSFKNPVLMRYCEKVIENDFIINKENPAIIITGSNTGGKTVILKSIGLLLLMTKAGLHIPCLNACIYPFEKIFANIGDEQSIVQSLSTFSSHMKNLVETINKADEKSLILIDEICSGTDPAEGAALAKSILISIKEKGAFSITTTHYGELKNLALSQDGFENASVRFDFDTLMPTYKFVQGIPGSSNAIAIAENLGLDKTITQNAQNNLSEITSINTEKFAQLEKTVEEASKNLENSKQNFIISENLKVDYEQKIEELKKEKKKIVQDYKHKIQSLFETSKEEMNEVMKKLRENETRQNTMNSIRKIAILRNSFQKELENENDTLKEIYTPINPETLKKGDKVIIKKLNQEAQFIEWKVLYKKAFILIGNMQSIVNVDKLAVFDKKIINFIPKKPEKKEFNIERTEISYRLDLRGYRYEDALREVESYLDKASRAGLLSVQIIHGHGTGVLKKAIREYLKDSPYVAKFRPGEKPEGDDGITVVELN